MVVLPHMAKAGSLETQCDIELYENFFGLFTEVKRKSVKLNHGDDFLSWNLNSHTHLLL